MCDERPITTESHYGETDTAQTNLKQRQQHRKIEEAKEKEKFLTSCGILQPSPAVVFHCFKYYCLRAAAEETSRRPLK